MFRITRNIWLGRFASPQRLPEMQQIGITHIVNVGEAPNKLQLEDGPFRRIDWIPIEDLVLIPAKSAIECLDTLHRAVSEEHSKTYIHCIAGQNRSPTILALYLFACGMSQNDAAVLINRSSYDAVPLHSSLVDAALIRTIREHGRSRYRPHPRPEALQASDSV